jgi:hypothetical protein
MLQRTEPSFCETAVFLEGHMSGFCRDIEDLNVSRTIEKAGTAIWT